MFSELDNKTLERSYHLLKTDSTKIGPTWWQSPEKRRFDRSLCILLAPAILGVTTIGGLYIWANDHEDPFAHLNRWHPNEHEIFKMHKIRTMIPQAEKQDAQIFGNSHLGKVKEEGDPRVLPHAKILRKTSADEFPQFWNVWKKEMSLTGPRPISLYEHQTELEPNSLLWPCNEWISYLSRGWKFGITGLSQILLRNTLEPRFRAMKLDLLMAKYGSLKGDIKIIMATLNPQVFFGGR